MVQLIVYVAQAEQARRENELAQRLHSELRASLADISARAHGTESTMETISEKLLDRALQRAGSSKLDDFPPGFTRDVAKNLAELMEQATDQPEPEEPEKPRTQFPTKDWGPEEDERVRRLLTHWPDKADEIDEIRSSLSGVVPAGLLAMSEMAEDELQYREPGTFLAPSVSVPEAAAAEPLYERELIEDYDQEAYGSRWTHLTEKGRRVARAFLAEGDPPEQIADFIKSIREAVSDAEEQDANPK